MARDSPFPRSPKLPLLEPSMANFAAEHILANTETAVSQRPSLGYIVWSVAEAALGLPRIEMPGEKGGDGIYVERTLLDAFLPFNATLSTVRLRRTSTVHNKRRRSPCACAWPRRRWRL